MNYTFELRSDKITKDGFLPIRLVVSHRGIRIKRSISVRTRIDDWDKFNSSIINSKSNPLYKEYLIGNKILAETKAKVEGIFNYFEFNNIPFSKEVFTEKYDEGNVNVGMSFFDAYDDFLRVSFLTKSEGTVKRYKTFKNFLYGFETYSGYKLRLDNIDYNFEELFMDYSFNIKKTLNNYYAKNIKSLKAFLNWAYQRGYHSSLLFKQLKSKEEEVEVIYLTIEELIKLYSYNFKNKSLERAKDMFCFLAFTGQRHSDIYAIKEANIEEDYLIFTVKKTKTVDHHVLLTKQAKEIIDKYKNTIYYPIPRISSQKLNQKIQRCCEIVGITQEVELTRYIGAKRITQTFRKCDLITSHCGRRTFITNSLFLGIPERVVRSISNHKDEKSFRRYVNISEIHKQRELTKWDSII